MVKTAEKCRKDSCPEKVCWMPVLAIKPGKGQPMIRASFTNIGYCDGHHLSGLVESDIVSTEGWEKLQKHLARAGWGRLKRSSATLEWKRVGMPAEMEELPF